MTLATTLTGPDPDPGDQEAALDLGRLLERAARRPVDRGVRFPASPGRPEDGCAYPELLDRSLRLAQALRGHGAVAGRAVMLLLERPEDFVPAIWACLLGGFPLCPVSVVDGAPQRAAHLEHLRATLEDPLVVVADGVSPGLPNSAVGAAVEFGQLISGASGPFADRHVSRPEDVALLLTTSGSTGLPKLVELTHANLLASVTAKAEVFELDHDDVVLNWIPFDHVAAFEGHLVPLAVGAGQIQVAAKTVLADPLQLLRLVDAHRATMTFTPNFLLGLINKELDRLPGGLAVDLTCLRRILSGGEANPVETGTAFLARLAPYGLRRGALWPAFGMTETCAGSIYNQEFPDADEGEAFAAVGRPIPGASMRVSADEAGTAVVDGQVGEVQMAGPMITRGYRGDHEATRAAFTADGWLRTGDLGRLDGGRLTLVGRIKDTVIVNGVNYQCHELEAVLNELEGIEPSFVTTFPTRPPGSDTEQLVIAFATAIPAEDEAAMHRLLVAIRNAVVLRWGFRPWLILPLPADAFAKTSLGKIRRSLMRQRLEAGDYAQTQARLEELIQRQLGGHTPPNGPTESAVAELYAELFQTDPACISVTASFFDLGGTSLDILRLKGRIAQSFPGTELPLTAILAAPTARDLARRIDAGRSAEPIPYDPVITLQPDGEKTPLFCVHPGVGEVLVFVNLAKHFLHERPFHALRARGFGAGEQTFQSFEEMVASYAEAIRARQPHGPYALAGYSFGAAVAFEIAKLFEADGERVGFLGNFNLPPHIKDRMEELAFIDTAVNLAMFLDLVPKQQAQELAEQLRPMSRADQLAHLIAVSPPSRLHELDLDQERLGAWADLASGLTRLARTYEPSGKVAAMSVFCAEPFRGTRQEWMDKLSAWDEFAGEVRYIPVPGEHYTLMGPRHLAEFQTILRAELDRALTGE